MLPDPHKPAEVSAGGALADQLGRPLRSLRVSVTDRCNLRCNYCMPQEEYVWLPRQESARLIRLLISARGMSPIRRTSAT